MCEDEAKSGKAVGFDDALQVHQFIALQHGLNNGHSTEKPLQATPALQWQKLMKPPKVPPQATCYSTASTASHNIHNTTLLPSVSVTAQGKMFCGAKYTRHTCAPIIKQQIKLQLQTLG